MADYDPGVQQQIGIIGIGRMGAPIAARLVDAGLSVAVHDVRAEREQAARDCGAQWRPSACAAAAGANVLITVLPGPVEVTAAVTEEVLAALAPGATWIDMSSNAPAAAAFLRERAEARGIGVLEAPIGGSPADAETGSLRLFVGGDGELLARHRALLELVADPCRIALVGGPGAGYTVKLLINLLWFGQAAATAEALLLGQRAGVDLKVLRDTLAESAAGSDFIRRDLSSLFVGDYLASYPLDRIHDQLTVVASMAAELATPYTITEQVRSLHQQALERYGPVDGELLAVALLEEQAGTRLRG